MEKMKKPHGQGQESSELAKRTQVLNRDLDRKLGLAFGRWNRDLSKDFTVGAMLLWINMRSAGFV